MDYKCHPLPLWTALLGLTYLSIYCKFHALFLQNTNPRIQQNFSFIFYTLAYKADDETVQVKINMTVGGTNRLVSQIAVGLCPDLRWGVKSVLLMHFSTWGVKWSTKWLNYSGPCSTSWTTLIEPSVFPCTCNSSTRSCHL